MPDYNMLFRTTPADIANAWGGLPGAMVQGYQAGQDRRYQMGQRVQQDQLNNLTLQSKQNELQNALARQKAIESGDPAALERVDPELAMKMETHKQNTQKFDIEKLAKRIDMTVQTAQVVANAPDDIILDRAIEAAQKLGQVFGTPPEEIQQQVERLNTVAANGGSQALRREILASAFTAKENLERAQKQQQLDISQQNADTSAGRLEWQKENPSGASADPINTPHVAQLMADGWVPRQRMTRYMLAAFEQAAALAASQGKPWTVEDAYDFEFNSQKNSSLGRTSGSRLVVARKQNIETGFELLDDMEKTGESLNYSDVKFQGALEKFMKGTLNDPKFTEYMTQRADALFVLGNALKQNGITDKAIEVEEEAANPTMSPRALKAWINTQRRALNRAAKEIQKDYKYDMTNVETVPAGQGGVAQPAAVPPPAAAQPPVVEQPQPLNTITVTNPSTGEEEVWDLTTQKRVR